LDLVEKRDFRKRELLEKYIVKILYRWSDRKFKVKYFKKLERNLEGGIISELKIVNLVFLFFSSIFYFLFYFLFLDLGLGFSMMSHVTVTHFSQVTVI